MTSTEPRGRRTAADTHHQEDKPMTRRRAAALTAAALVVVALVTGCHPNLAPRTPAASASSPSSAAGAAGGSASTPAAPAGAEHVPAGTFDAATARAKLAELQVAVPGSLDGYVRDCGKGKACVFGQPWKDTDHDGCDQRSQVLARDLADVVKKPGRCSVTAGKLLDPYTGETLTVVSKIQIDHVVPLGEMWRSGAAAWPLERRVQAANDLGNLLAVQGKANEQKGDKTPDKWLPPLSHCLYSRIYVTTKSHDQLTVTAPEVAALKKVLGTC